MWWFETKISSHFNLFNFCFDNTFFSFIALTKHFFLHCFWFALFYSCKETQENNAGIMWCYMIPTWIMWCYYCRGPMGTTTSQVCLVSYLVYPCGWNGLKHLLTDSLNFTSCKVSKSTRHRPEIGQVVTSKHTQCCALKVPMCHRWLNLVSGWLEKLTFLYKL